MSDLPIQVPPSEQYGQGVAHEAAQQEVPMAPGGIGAVDPAAPPVGPLGGGGPTDQVPGEIGMFGGETERPDEPITSGIDDGLGPGSESLHLLPRKRGTDILRRAAAETQDPVLMALVERMGL